MICWIYNAEKPGAFPQEKTDTSYPRASLGSCPWQLLLTTAPHGSNRACSGLRWCRSPTCPPKSHTGSHRAEFWFSLQNELTPPPKGGGAGYHLTWLAGILMQRSPVLFRRKRRMLRIRGLLSAVACGNCCSQLPHTAPTGPVRGFGGVVPLPGPQNLTQGRV